MAQDKRLILNERIRATRMLVIDETGEKLGEISREEALELAQKKELDLALVSATSRPPVAKIIDYGKYLYEQKKAAKKQANAGKALDVKGVRIGLRIGEHDLLIREKAAIKFLEKGHKVKVQLMFRGREIAHIDLGFNKIRAFAERLEDHAKIEQEPRRAGHQLVMLIAPRTKQKNEEKKPESPKKAQPKTTTK